MNARVFLLALVTAAFMAIWDADRPVEGRAAVVQSECQNVGVPSTNAVSIRLPLVAAEHSRESLTNAAASTTANHESLTLLSKNLQPGTWQAKSLDGNTFRITIERIKSLTGSTSRDTQLSEPPEKSVLRHH